MTSFDLAAIVSELKEITIGFRLENIYQLDPFTLLFSLRSGQRLIIEAGKRVHLTEYDVEKPPSPALFCQLLRKYLRGGIIQDVRTDGFERILTVEVSFKEASYKLVSEIFGRGNIILLDDEDKVLHALSYRRMRDRNIIRGEAFKPPPLKGSNPLEITRLQLKGLKEQKVTVVRALTNLLSIGGLYAEEILQRSQIDKGTVSNILTDKEIDRIYDAVAELSSDLTIRRHPHIIIDDEGKWVDVLPFLLTIYKGFKVKEFSTFNEASDEYFTKLKLGREELESSKDINQKIDEQKRILLQQKERFKELEKNAEENQLIGDMIHIHSRKLQSIIESILERRRSGEEWNNIISTVEKEEPAKFLESIDPKQGVALVKIGDKRFELDLQKTVYQNASRFYKTAKEAREKIEGLKTAIAETERKIGELQKLGAEAGKQVRMIAKVRERSWFEKFHWINSSEGFLIIGGRDASTNELLIKRYMNPGDIVLHADFPGAPFVLIKTDGKYPSEQTINEAAQLAASYSRAWREGVTSLDVYWVKPDQISKSAPSGEYLSKGMFMIYGQKNYIRDVPLRISIGITDKAGQLAIIGGPVSAIASHARYRIDIIPGKQTSGRLTKEILHRLAEKAPTELRGQILKLPLDDVQRFIPAGGVCLA